MSTATDLQDRLHETQLGVAKRFQDVVIKTAKRINDLTDDAPRPPARLTEVTEKLARPVTRLVGTREEISGRLASYNRDWVAQLSEFRRELNAVVNGSSADLSVPDISPSTRPAKKSTAKKTTGK